MAQHYNLRNMNQKFCSPEKYTKQLDKMLQDFEKDFDRPDTKGFAPKGKHGVTKYTKGAIKKRREIISDISKLRRKFSSFCGGVKEYS